MGRPYTILALPSSLLYNWASTQDKDPRNTTIDLACVSVIYKIILSASRSFYAVLQLDRSLISYGANHLEAADFVYFVWPVKNKS